MNVALCAAAVAMSDTLLQTLPNEYVKAPWRAFSNEDSKAAAFLAFTKELSSQKGEGLD